MNKRPLIIDKNAFYRHCNFFFFLPFTGSCIYFDFIEVHMASAAVKKKGFSGKPVGRHFDHEKYLILK